MTGHQLHHLTVKSLLERYFVWRYQEFQKLIVYPILPNSQSRRREIVKLDKQGWSEQSITVLVKGHRSTVRKWLRRNKEEEKLRVPLSQQLLDYTSRPLKPHRKVYFGTIHTMREFAKEISSYRMVSHSWIFAERLQYRTWANNLKESNETQSATAFDSED